MSYWVWFAFTETSVEAGKKNEYGNNKRTAWAHAGFAIQVTDKFVDEPLSAGRIAQPSNIAPTAVFLASDEASWLTGEIILASGGLR